MARSIAAALEGRCTVGLAMPRRFNWASRVSRWAPRSVRQSAYAYGSMLEALPPEQFTPDLDEVAARELVSPYDRIGRVPAIFIGATNGAVADLAADIGAPWLPQTFLLLLRRERTDVDDVPEIVRQADHLTGRLERAFPKAKAYQMHDPENDRPNVRRAFYLRMKWRRLPRAYRQFVESRLCEGGTVFVVDSRYKWPSLRLGEQHFFQIGGYGAADPDDIPKRYAAAGSGWRARAEAEWGFDGAILPEIVDAARARNGRVVRLRFDDPQDMSDAAATLFLQQTPEQHRRLLVTNFNMLAPAHILGTGAVPYWTVFNDLGSLGRLAGFLGSVPRFEAIDSLLFQNGVVARGQADPSTWRRTLADHAPNVQLLGLRPREHPCDFGVFEAYRRELRAIEDTQVESGRRIWVEALANLVADTGVVAERLQ